MSIGTTTAGSAVSAGPAPARKRTRGWRGPLFTAAFVAPVPLLGRMDSALYTDRIHLNDRGQAVLADVLVEIISPSAPANTFGHDPSSPTR